LNIIQADLLTKRAAIIPEESSFTTVKATYDANEVSKKEEARDAISALFITLENEMTSYKGLATRYEETDLDKFIKYDGLYWDTEPRFRTAKLDVELQNALEAREVEETEYAALLVTRAADEEARLANEAVL
jgi:hypothetical protein